VFILVKVLHNQNIVLHLPTNQSQNIYSLTKSNIMTTTTYTYETSAGTNVETFASSGYVTLTQNGLFKYEHHFGSHILNLQEQMLVAELTTRNIQYTKTIN